MSSPQPARGHDRRGDLDDTPRLPSEQGARTLLDRLPAVVYVADVGVGGRWHYVSSGALEMLGFTPQQWVADPGLWARQVHPDDRERVFGREDELAEPSIPEEYRMVHRDGRVVWVRDEAALVCDGGGDAVWHGVISDITDRKLAETELERRAEQQAAVARLGKSALEGAQLGALMQDALEQATRILGVDCGAVLERAVGSEQALVLRAEVGLADLDPLQPLGDAALAGGARGEIDGREGSWGVLALAPGAEARFAAADADFVQALANILADALRQRAAEDDIRYQALHDPLTGLPNRVLFMDRLGHTLSRPGAEAAVVLLDIDNFKLVNDSLGHTAGDELLTQIAPRLQSAVRPGDTIARLGGDEFVVLLEKIPDERAAARVAERIVAAFDVPFELSVGEQFAKASLGIVLARDSDSRPADLVRDADAAMYQAKSRGRGRFEVFDRAMRMRTVARLSLENDLRRALERAELRLAYQPIVSLQDRSLVSVEALLRWQHPERGLVAPEQFIPVAEESGLIEPIGRWVLEAACAQAVQWHALYPDSRPLGISVNLSMRQLAQSGLESTVARALELTGVEPSSLCLEITESVLLEEPARVSETIRRVARLGVRFALDDFGTGYSSLAYLAQLPIDGLKVDRSFVQSLGSDERSTAITTAIVRMAQALSLDVIAEGVESEQQLLALGDLGCELAQGFHLYKPLPASAVSRLLAPAPEPVASLGSPREPPSEGRRAPARGAGKALAAGRRR